MPFCGFRYHGKKKKRLISKISASADGGPRSRVCARETLRSALEEIFGWAEWGAEGGGVKIFKNIFWSIFLPN